MRKVIATKGVPVKLWLDEPEQEAMKQAENIAILPFTYKWVALMPDTHKGYGVPIGGVFAALNAVVPNAVGVDIGCGMSSVKTSLTGIERGALKRIVNRIRKEIPVGFQHHKSPVYWEGFERSPEIAIVTKLLDSARYQLGTLGGGNHFIEIQKGSDSHIWIMVHSGSRNFGYRIAKHFYKKALSMCDKERVSLPDKNLAFFSLDSKAAEEYLSAMEFALDFAKASRFYMMERVKNILTEETGGVEFSEGIDIHHNYAALETHYGESVVVHRKGATSAREGEKGIIPGSQGANSYIVTGKGNPESFMSCSHGAGRQMGRRQAQKVLNLEKEKDFLDSRGIIHSIKGKKDLDEASGAYKNITEVMENQSDLVDINTELSPLAVVKG